MDKKSIVVIAVCMLLLFLWRPLTEKIWPPIPVPESVETAGTTNEISSVSATSLTNNAATASLVEAPVVSPAVATSALTSTNLPAAPAQLATLENDLFKLTLTSDGGGVKLIELKKYPRHVNRQAADDTSLATLNDDAPLPLLAIGNDRNSYTWHKTGDESAQATARWANGLTVLKEFTLSSNYLLQAHVRIENPTKAAVGLPALEWSLGASTPLGSRLDARFTGVLWYDGKSKNSITESWFQNKFLGCFPGTPRSVYQAGSSNVVWAGVQNQFFALLTVPDHPANEVIAHPFDLPPPSAADLAANPRQTMTPVGQQAALIYPPTTIAAGGSLDRTFTIYAGPKEYNVLSQIAFHRHNQLDLVMNFSGFWGYFAKGLLFSMNGLHNHLEIPYGLTIVLITLLLKTAFWPLTTASTKSMKRMSKLQPQMKAIQEKYKEDPQKMQRKLMEFMKENKVNPMGSCLPLVLQMPIFIGFYTMLQSAIELRGAHFLWIHDLSSPDTLFIIPGLGLPFNLMPLIMGCTMLFQARLTPPSPGMDPAQQTMMRYMPLMFMFILYGMSSGLTLYWTVQNLLSILQTKLTKTDDEKAGGASGQNPVAALPGGGKRKR